MYVNKMTINQRAVLDYNKLCFILVFCVLFYNEYLAYYSAYSRWPSLPQSPDSLKILFVADPQIQGLKYEGPFGPITRWDSDRYLRKGYSWAMSAYSPQVVVFLGDLIDEGSECDNDTFVAYAERFFGIYGGYHDDVKTVIYVAGDNDIGGEGSDPVTDEKISRFQQRFPQKTVYTFSGNSGVESSSNNDRSVDDDDSPKLEIIPVNFLLTKSSTAPTELPDMKTPSQNNFRIVVSHLPVTPQTGDFTVKVLKQLQPSLIVSAHNHHGMDYVGTRKTGSSGRGNVTRFTQKDMEASDSKFLVIKQRLTFDTPVNELNIESPRKEAAAGEAGGGVEASAAVDAKDTYVHEIVVPTCSYRMGVKEMAFGLAVFDAHGDPQLPQLHYTNLWLPNRFASLYLYTATVLCAFVLLCLGRCQAAKRGRRNSRTGRRSASSSPSPRSKYAKLV